MIISEIQSDIELLEKNASLFIETNFGKRADALDFIDFHILDRMIGLPGNDKLLELKLQATHLKNNLEKVDVALFEKLRQNIRNGGYKKLSFKEIIDTNFGSSINEPNQQGEAGYDNFDVFINGLFSPLPVPEPTRSLTPEMVFYQKTPVRVVLEMTDLLQFTDDDEFVDIGSGLGQVTMLVNLLTGVRTRGIEYEPAYCNYAKTCASHLNLRDVTFINVNALEADYSQGTTFFLYTPFGGTMLQDMLEILKKEATKRQIKVVTYGPCSAEIANQRWLGRVIGDVNNLYHLCVFISLNP